MGASCGGDIDDDVLFESYKAVGLQAQHAYSVLDVRAVGQNRYEFNEKFFYFLECCKLLIMLYYFMQLCM